VTILFCAPFARCQDDPEESMNATEMIHHWGYPVETHEVVTADGYILSLLRIPHGPHSKGNSSCRRPPVMMAHGLFSDASEFVANPPASSPAMILADAGFDVFLLNVRGTTLSQRHLRFTNRDRNFWKFTADDMAKYDATASIDKALALNGAKSLHWIGHSQGTLIGFFFLADLPDYNRKVQSLIQLSSVGTLHWTKGFARVIKVFVTFLKSLFTIPMEIGQRDKRFTLKILKSMCPPTSMLICKNFLEMYAGPSSQSFNWSRGAVYMSKVLESTSSWNYLHFLQNHNLNHAYHFDVSPFENLKRYGNIKAPPYNYSNINSDVYFFWSRNDWLTPPKEIERYLAPQMKCGIIKGSFEIPEYNHADFVFATDVADRVFKRITGIIRKYESNFCLD
ncbi:hypothetical protein PMAYCL1PPCAC_16887, partial [Pristionchus mayeri]